MWVRFNETLRCPRCGGALVLRAFSASVVRLSPDVVARGEALGVARDRLGEHVESGALLCEPCAAMYPVLDGLPILLGYATPMHATFVDRHREQLQQLGDYGFAHEEPVAGERAVMRSFSKEWLDYDYDGVIWEMNYEDHEQRFLKEIGGALARAAAPRFLEVGCGLGITTYLAQKNGAADAVGVDLSLAVWKASRHYRDNPFLHFVQASAFALPFAAASFDLVYSRGVLHHTYSTRHAFASIAPLCRPGGMVYLWVYGVGSVRETPLRRVAYGLERVFRPALSAAPDSRRAKAFLTVMGIGYVAFNALRRATNPRIQPLTLARGIHAARDRFTPQYAHRHEVDEVVDWFRRAGFVQTEVVDWKSMPAADHDDYRRNVGVRGMSSLSSAT